LCSSSILAFIGLGLTFWGALILYIRPAKYVKASLLDYTVISSLETVDQIITDLDYKGKAIYLPPRYIKDLKGGKVFIPSKENLSIPPSEEIAEEKVFLKNPKGICLTPPGVALANLYENKLRKSFIEVDLNYLQNNLPKLFIEGLEIAEDLEIKIEGNIVKTRITGSIIKDLCNETRELPNICGSIGCPLCSSIAIALTRSTGKTLIIEKTEASEDGETIEATFRLLETPESEEQTPALLQEAVEVYLSRRPFSSAAGLFLTAFGSIILAWVGWLTWYDMTLWGKDIDQLGNRHESNLLFSDRLITSSDRFTYIPSKKTKQGVEMRFPLSLWDISLWLAVTAIILLVTSELISPHYGKTNLLIEKKRLRNVALAISILFLITVAIRIYEIIITS
jgi:hypothetical protein